MAGLVGGVVQGIAAKKQMNEENEKLDALFAQRTAFKTPKEAYDILNLSQSEAQQGFSDQTMDYFTGQAGAGLAGTLGVAKRLGADPNQLDSVLDRYYGDIFRIGAESDLVKMKKTDQFTKALGLIGANKEAEWQSQENIIKDQMQAASSRFDAQNAQWNSAFGLLTNSATNLAIDDLYTEDINRGRRLRRRPGTRGGGLAGGNAGASAGAAGGATDDVWIGSRS